MVFVFVCYSLLSVLLQSYCGGTCRHGLLASLRSSKKVMLATVHTPLLSPLTFYLTCLSQIPSDSFRRGNTFCFNFRSSDSSTFFLLLLLGFIVNAACGAGFAERLQDGCWEISTATTQQSRTRPFCAELLDCLSQSRAGNWSHEKGSTVVDGILKTCRQRV